MSNRGPEAPGPARGRVIVIAGVMLFLGAVVSGMALYRAGDDHPTARPTVGWGGGEGHPSCVYDPGDETVDCTLVIDGEEHQHDEVTVTITAYADENTSQPVGSTSRIVQVKGTLHQRVVVTVPVEKAPHVDEDGETACRLSVEH